MAMAGNTTLSTNDQELFGTDEGDLPCWELVLWNRDSTNAVLVNVSPLHPAGTYLTIPPTPASVAPIPVYLKGTNDKITKMVAHGAAGTPVLSWGVSEI